MQNQFINNNFKQFSLKFWLQTMHLNPTESDNSTFFFELFEVDLKILIISLFKTVGFYYNFISNLQLIIGKHKINHKT